MNHNASPRDFWIGFIAAVVSFGLVVVWPMFFFVVAAVLVGMLVLSLLGRMVSPPPPVVTDVDASAENLADKCLSEIDEKPYPHQERMNSYAAELRRQIDSEVAASAVIGDNFPARAGSTDTLKTKEVIERTPAVTATTPSAGGLPSFRSLEDWEINATRAISPPRYTELPVAEQSAAATRSPLPLP